MCKLLAQDKAMSSICAAAKQTTIARVLDRTSNQEPLSSLLLSLFFVPGLLKLPKISLIRDRTSSSEAPPRPNYKSCVLLSRSLADFRLDIGEIN